MSKSWFVSCEFTLGPSFVTATSPRLDSTEKVLDAVRRMLPLDGVIEITSETDPTSAPVAIIAEEVQPCAKPSRSFWSTCGTLDTWLERSAYTRMWQIALGSGHAPPAVRHGYLADIPQW